VRTDKRFDMTKLIVALHNFAKAPANATHTRYDCVDRVQCGSGKDVKYFLVTIQCPMNVRHFMVAEHRKMPRRLSSVCEAIIKCTTVTIRQLCILNDNGIRANFVKTGHIASEAASSTLRLSIVTGVNSPVVMLHVVQQSVT
jgi:hypothetical protein